MQNANSWSRRRAAASERGRKMGCASQAVQRAARSARDPDADTVFWRARFDARGEVLRCGAIYQAGRDPMPWALRRTVAGRWRQFDLVAGPRVHRTAGTRGLAPVLHVSGRRLAEVSKGMFSE